MSFLIEEKLAPSGIVTAPHRGPARPQRSPVLALGLRGTILPQRAVNATSRALAPLFRMPVVVAVVAGVAAFDAWLFLDHGVGRILARRSRPSAIVLS